MRRIDYSEIGLKKLDCNRNVKLDVVTDKDVERYLSGYEIEPDALNELVSRACNNQTGCFRLLDRTLNNVFRIVNESNQSIITLKMISQASNMMML